MTRWNRCVLAGCFTCYCSAGGGLKHFHTTYVSILKTKLQFGTRHFFSETQSLQAYYHLMKTPYSIRLPITKKGIANAIRKQQRQRKPSCLRQGCRRHAIIGAQMPTSLDKNNKPARTGKEKSRQHPQKRKRQNHGAIKISIVSIKCICTHVRT